MDYMDVMDWMDEMDGEPAWGAGGEPPARRRHAFALSV